MTFLHQISCLIIRVIKFALSFLEEDRRLRIIAQLQNEIVPVKRQKTPHGEIQFFCPEILPLWRAQTLLTKEPETIEWINQFEKKQILYDIGANVGVYSLYAAKQEHQVFAFEPSAFNYHILVKNVQLNQFQHLVSPVCLAFSHQVELGTINMGDVQAGGALHHFGEEVDTIDSLNQNAKTVFRHSMIGYSIDEFIRVFNPPFPNHLKIDVDGIEHLIIEGAKQTLRDSRLKSILIELDLSQSNYSQQQIKSQIERAGFSLTLQQRIEMQGHTLGNCIFNRD